MLNSDENKQKLVKYLEKTWIGPKARFQHSMWNHFDSSYPKNSNVAENFHRWLNDKFFRKQFSFYHVLERIILYQDQEQLKLELKQNGRIKQRDLYKNKRINFDNLFKMFKSGEIDIKTLHAWSKEIHFAEKKNSPKIIDLHQLPIPVCVPTEPIFHDHTYAHL